MVSENEKKSIATGLSLEVGVPLGEILRLGDTKVSVSRTLDDAQIKAISNMIRQGFIDHNQHSYLKQDMTYEEFEKEAKDPNVLKYIAESRGSEGPQGYLSIHTNLEDIVWADTTRLKQLQNQLAPAELSFYVGTFVVPKELRGFKLSGVLLEGALSQLINFNRLNGNKSLCFFDRSDSGSSAMREFVDRKLKKLAGANPSFTVSEIYKATFFKKASEPGQVLETYTQPPEESQIVDIQHYYQIAPPEYQKIAPAS